MSWLRSALPGAVLVLLLAVAAVAWADGPELEFVRDGKVVARLDHATLARECGVRTVELDDPYYGHTMAYRACPLARVLELGFGASPAELAGEDFLLRARDGYVKPAPGKRLLEPGGFLAIADARHATGDDPGWQPIDRRQVDPGPYYVVWQDPAQHDTHRYPWPYQLVRIEIAALETQYPHVVPHGVAPTSDAWRGFEIFASDCIACHAVNGQGGKVGPDLNVPRSIVEYRPAEQIKAFIRDPSSFRYTSMPAHEYLTDAQLDELIAYFRAMSTRKRDPGRAS